MAFPQVASLTPTAFTSNTTQHLVAMPATVDAGDLLLMIVVFDGGPTITNPSGWTELLNVPSEQNHGKIVTAKVADGTEDGTTVDVVTSAAEQAAAHVYRITGWHGTISTGVEVGTSNGAGGVTTNSPPAFNPTNWDVDDTLWIAVLAIGPGATALDISGYPASYTNGTETDTAGGSAGAIVATARRENATASEDAGDFTMTNAPAGSRAFVIAVRPGAAGTPHTRTVESTILSDLTD